MKMIMVVALMEDGSEVSILAEESDKFDLKEWASHPRRERAATFFGVTRYDVRPFDVREQIKEKSDEEMTVVLAIGLAGEQSMVETLKSDAQGYQPDIFDGLERIWSGEETKEDYE